MEREREREREREKRERVLIKSAQFLLLSPPFCSPEEGFLFASFSSGLAI